jgi:membrane protease YdiL (CAAX protease family)
LHSIKDRPSWGIVEIVIVYMGILASSLLFSYPRRHNGAGLEQGVIDYFVAGFIVQFFATVGLVMLFTVILNKASWKAMGFAPGKLPDLLKYGLLGGIFLVLLISVMGYLINYLNPHLQPQAFEQVLRSAISSHRFGLLLLIGVILAPFSEELFYRSMIYPVFRGYVGPRWGAVISGLIFGLAHWDIWRALPLAIGGAILCLFYEKTRNIWVPTIAHGVWNGIMVLVLLLELNSGGP